MTAILGGMLLQPVENVHLLIRRIALLLNAI